MAEQVANVYNNNCWVYERPLRLETWPWVSTPISPEWLASNSRIDHGTPWEVKNTCP